MPAAGGGEEPDRLLSYADVAEMSGLRPAVLRGYVRQGRLPAPDETVDGRPRWRVATIQAWLDRRAARAATLASSARRRTLEGGEPLRYRDIAALTGLSVRVLRTYAHRGSMPAPDASQDDQPRWEPSTIQAWLAEREARAAARRSPKPASTSRASRMTDRNRAAAIAALDPIRADLLAALRTGAQLGDAARALGTSTATVLRRARWDLEWREDLDAAQLPGRDPKHVHGTLTSYQRGCRCSDCRTMRRAYDRRYRGLPGPDGPSS